MRGPPSAQARSQVSLTLPTVAADKTRFLRYATPLYPPLTSGLKRAFGVIQGKA